MNLHYPTVEAEFLLNLFGFHIIWATWIHIFTALLAPNLMTYIAEAAWDWNVEHSVSHCIYNISPFNAKVNFWQEDATDLLKLIIWLPDYDIYSIKILDEPSWCAHFFTLNLFGSKE